MDNVVQTIINDIMRSGVQKYKCNLKPLGRGHFSTVYKHPEDDTKVIKITTADVCNDGYPIFVDYIKNKQAYSIYPVVYEMHELQDKNDYPFNISVSERLFDYYELNREYQDKVKHMFGALMGIDDNFMIDAIGDADLISKLFQNYKKRIPYNWGQLNTAQCLELLEVHSMLYTLCSEWEPNWGMIPDIGGSNVMVRITPEHEFQCVVTDPIACGDIFHVNENDEEFIA